MQKIGAKLLLAATIAVGSGCGEASSTGRESADKPRRVSVPTVVGDRADEGAERIERAGLSVEFVTKPSDADLCKVKDQSESGSVAPDTVVLLTLACKVIVPSVVGQEASAAAEKIESRGRVTVSFDGESGDPGPGCIVEAQDERGRVPAFTEVVLTVDCPIVVADVRDQTRSLARKIALRDGGDYDIYDCKVVSSDEGQCELDLYGAGDGIECTSTVTVTDEGESYYSEETAKDCR